MAKKKTDMVVAKSTDLLPEGTEFEVLVENLAEMNEMDFPRIRFNNGKFKFSDDQEEGVDEFEGVLLFYGRQNTYWEGNYDSNNPTPPECFSVDGESGSKSRDSSGCYGECKSCAYNKFGSGIGKGKLCRNQMKLYIHVLGTTVPHALFLAPTSLGGFTQNFIMNKIVQRGLSYFKVITKVKSFKKAASDTYFRIGFEVSNVFKGEEAEKVKDIRNYWLEPIKSDRSRLDASVTGESNSSGNESNSSGNENEKEEETNQRTIESKKPVGVASNSSGDDNDDNDDDPPF